MLSPAEMGIKCAFLNFCQGTFCQAKGASSKPQTEATLATIVNSFSDRFEGKDSEAV